ncbi:MAG: type II toxin-antitoxin system VapB family antitoxin [Egibacteraceae bacterium]
MTDLLIRDVPDDVVAAIDANAKRLGLSRSEYLRRRLARDAVPVADAVTVEDLVQFAEAFGDLSDSEVMARAWQ